MNKVYITGDTHASIRDRFEFFAETVGPGLDKDDYVVICGDFGGIWFPTETNPYMNESQMERWLEQEDYNLDWLNSCPWTTLFVSGNHENYDRLYKLPRKEWHGGMVRIVRDSILLLERGNVFDICGKQFFAFGGASSHDIKDGVLEAGDPRVEEWAKDRFKLFRINHVSWWERELPTQGEMDLGFRNLSNVDFKVDYVISHTLPNYLIRRLGFKDKDILTDYFEELDAQLDYKQWYCGHYHVNRRLGDRHTICYENITRIV